jgi:membrane associated rhomboid family serine protease
METSETSITQTCYRHPSRETGVSCSNCGRPICPDCMTPTNVGMRCPECAKQRTKVVTMRSLPTKLAVTQGLIVVNVLVFLTEGQFGFSNTGGGTAVYQKGALLGSNPLLPGQGVAEGQYWRIVTGAFLHAGLLHIALNMYVLYLLGQLLEPAIGSLRFGVVYAVSLLAGSFGALLLTPHTLTVGASGAIFGLMAAALVEARARRIQHVQNWLFGLIIINLALSFGVSNISVGGHIGGLIGGALAGLALQAGERYRSQALAYGLCAVIGVASVAGCIITSKNSQVTLPGATGAPAQIAPPPGQ